MQKITDQNAPQKAAPVQLHPKMHPTQACGTIAQTCLAQLAANAAGVLASDDPEFIHQARVALRRLRSALRLFRPHLDVAFYARFDPELRWLAGLLGHARDWDVLASQTVPRILNPAGAQRAGAAERALAQAIAPRREQCRGAVRKALRSRRYRQLMRTGEAEFSALEQLAPDDTRLRDFAAARLKRVAKKLHIKPRALHAMDAEKRHRVRIHAKRLRYAIDFFASLYKYKRVRRYEAPLGRLQDALGRLNDEAVALSLFAALPVTESALRALHAGLQAGTEDCLAEAEKALRKLADAEPFWTA